MIARKDKINNFFLELELIYLSGRVKAFRPFLPLNQSDTQPEWYCSYVGPIGLLQVKYRENEEISLSNGKK